VGARRPGQINGIVGAAEFHLSAQEAAEIEAFFDREAARADHGPHNVGNSHIYVPKF
jgi:hypothetical protein